MCLAVQSALANFAPLRGANKIKNFSSARVCNTDRLRAYFKFKANASCLWYWPREAVQSQQQTPQRSYENVSSSEETFATIMYKGHALCANAAPMLHDKENLNALFRKALRA